MLYLVPNLLGLTAPEKVLPAETIDKTCALRHFVVETPKAARAFLGSLNMPLPIRELNLMPIAEKPFAQVLALWKSGEAVGMLSDAGCPGVADPGASLVAFAHQNEIKVVPLVGPSSLLLGLMSSGLNGQSFTFHGYLPQDKAALAKRLSELSKTVMKEGSAELFIETPYRHAAMLEAITSNVATEVALCLAQDLSTDNERILTLPINKWTASRTAPFLRKAPTLFILGKLP